MIHPWLEFILCRSIQLSLSTLSCWRWGRKAHFLTSFGCFSTPSSIVEILMAAVLHISKSCPLMLERSRKIKQDSSKYHAPMLQVPLCMIRSCAVMRKWKNRQIYEDSALKRCKKKKKKRIRLVRFTLYLVFDLLLTHLLEKVYKENDMNSMRAAVRLLESARIVCSALLCWVLSHSTRQWVSSLLLFLCSAVAP